MSTIVGLTGGASCNDVGLTGEACQSEQTLSIKSQQRLRSSGVRDLAMKAYAMGDTKRIHLERRSFSPWQGKHKLKEAANRRNTGKRFVTSELRVPLSVNSPSRGHPIFIEHSEGCTSPASLQTDTY